MSRLYEVYRDRDSVKVGLYDQLLKEAGMNTLLRNWTGANIVEIPIPEFFPNICLLTEEDYLKAKQIIAEYESDSVEGYPAWECPACHEIVAGNFAECWSCQSSHPES